MKHLQTYKLFENEQQEYYTTSSPMNIDTFIEIEVEERENYEADLVQEWVDEYNITPDSALLWVATTPWIAARYQMPAGDWDDCEKIYKANPEDYEVYTVNSSDGVLITDSNDGDDGFLMVMNDDNYTTGI